VRSLRFNIQSTGQKSQTFPFNKGELPVCFGLIKQSDFSRFHVFPIGI